MKSALCVKKMDVWNAGIALDKADPTVYPFSEMLYGLQSKLIDREICETDPTLLQLIPYIIIQREDSHIFTYVRGNATGEERLRSKLSIGLGGHVDDAPMFDEPATFATLLQLEAARELREEVGLVVDPHEINFQGLLYEEISDVGKVHLGLFALYKVPSFKVVEEEGHITKGVWLSIEKLKKPENYDRLELWSRGVVDHLAGENNG